MFITFLVTVFLSIASVLIHYEALLRIASLMNRISIRPRGRILVAVIGVLVAHVAEVWLFVGGYYFLTWLGNCGKLVGNFSGDLLDYSYYSFSTYTSLGFGDITPEGPMRFLTGMEALTGLVLIAWTASFMFLEMQRFWKKRDMR